MLQVTAEFKQITNIDVSFMVH